MEEINDIAAQPFKCPGSSPTRICLLGKNWDYVLGFFYIVLLMWKLVSSLGLSRV